MIEQGAGSAVADLKAGYGQGRMEQAVERGRQFAEAMGAAAPETSAGEVAANFRMAAEAGALPVGVGVAASDDEVVDMPNPVVEQGDGFYWMEQARYWEERCLRAEGVNPLSPSELEQERTSGWGGRGRRRPFCGKFLSGRSRWREPSRGRR